MESDRESRVVTLIQGGKGKGGGEPPHNRDQGLFDLAQRVARIEQDMRWIRWS